MAQAGGVTTAIAGGLAHILICFTVMAAMTFDDFTGAALQAIGVTVAQPVFGHSGLFDDLSLDSLQAVQLLFAVEAMAGCDVPPPDLPEIFTMGDAYEYYCDLVRSP
jgi:hypothetical protein